MYSSTTRPQVGRKKLPGRNRGVTSSSTNNNGNNNSVFGFPLTIILVIGMIILMVVYLGGMLLLANTTATKSGSGGASSVHSVTNTKPQIGLNNKLRQHNHHQQQHQHEKTTKQHLDALDNTKEDNRKPESNDTDNDEGDSGHSEDDVDNENNSDKNAGDSRRKVLKAYIEPIDQTEWEKTPLPLRSTTADDLKVVEFPGLSSCNKLPEQWPVDNYPDDDPFLPWIHDVFPSHDGTHIQFIAQNKRRCKTGTTEKEIKICKNMAPQVALFQHVAVKRVQDHDEDEDEEDKEVRYQLVPHDEADEDGMDARYLCRFSNGQETLSVFNFSYEWASYRKKGKKMFREDGRDNKQIHTSQLLFRCPVPDDLIETVRTGSSVVDDYATVFVDLIPLRTPPRYGPPNEFLPPYYEEFKDASTFDPVTAWGDNQIMPKIQDSGRWENIPICKPSLLEYGKQEQDSDVLAPASATEKVPYKANKLVSCLWASAGYATRGERFAINDGQRRLLEWVTYNKLMGVEHFYLYDNTAAHTTETSLQPIADLFPDDITLIKWPSKVCNNNKNNVDSVGERSSQYAAEASCRLRFGPHTEWLGQFDIDEYLVPMGELKSIHPVLDKLDNEGKKIISFGSWRAWPRRRFIEDPNLTRRSGPKNCGRNTDCFDLSIPMNQTMLQAYNCDRQKPGEKSKQMPAEKQIYRPDYVLHHFIHYSTVTVRSNMNKQDIEKLGAKWSDRSPFPDPLSRFGDEKNEA
eukprot:CAMPEP_0113502182 /NCGR_PEP_ID=MMETSP0014_2-20120614/33398_1 /TAXON_ID=2857 /ORGANISM="Nitzschia sp." /LENGTH=743 /DNA_ID=CAMNT_0000396913 /DNA_START=88 /DNA_END=2315 /DNA_ORIENTATION=+ /assembly_acc=CAM_ASM_000159